MKTTKVNTIIEDFNALPAEDKEFALDIIKRIYVEERREAIYKKSRRAIGSVKKGRVKQGTLKDLYKDLEND